MKAFVITIKDHKASKSSADRAVKQAKLAHFDAKIFPALTPETVNVFHELNERGISKTGFYEKYSRLEKCIAAFLSHYSLWERCIELNEPILILEHDAVFIDFMPKFHVRNGDLISLGKPSYGKWKIPPKIGLNKLVSKPYLPGAHAYIVTPNAAQELINETPRSARPTDVYINNQIFPFLYEYYPWIIEANDSFTTIQRVEGCYAKTNYNKIFPKYEIL